MTGAGMQPRPLAGFTILELATHLPGPLCGLLLADLGARVIKVEAPGRGDPMRQIDTRRFAAANRGKRSVCLDLRTPEGREALAALVARSDAVIDGSRPEVAEHLGITYAALRAANPRVVLLSVTGYGQTGTMRNWAGHDINFAGLGGALTTSGEPRELRGIYFGDICGGLYGTITLLATLIQARASGHGCHIDLAMAEAAAAALAAYHCFGLNPDPALPVVEGAAGYGLFRCRDGGTLSLAAFEDRLWALLCDAVGRPDLQGVPLTQRVDHARFPALNAELQRVLLERDLDEWVAILGPRGVPAAPVREAAALATDPQLSERGLVVHGDDGYRYIRFPGLLGGEPLPLGTTAPALGQDTATVLAEANLSPALIAALDGSRNPMPSDE